MAITPQNPGAIDTPNTLTPDSAGSVAVPNTLTPESAGSVAVPNTLTPESTGSISAPNSLAAESAGSVAVPNTLNAETAGSVAVPNTLTSSDAKALPRALTPTVDINYADGLFAQNGSAVAESDLITFARASTATFINRQLGATGRYEYFLDTAASGVQRIEYDAATGENLGALIEQASTNLCLRSEEFDNASWVKSSATITANDTTAPDLTTSADKLEASSTGSSSPAARQGITSTPAASYTVSVFVKRSEASFLQINFSGGEVTSDPRVNFDLSTGSTGSQDANITAASVTLVGGDWFRISATVTAASTSLNVSFRLISSATDTRAQSNSWTAGDGLYIWGAQIEQAAIPTSYIPTTTTAVSRLADQVSIPVAGNVPSGDVTFHAEINKRGDKDASRYIFNTNALTGSIGAYANDAADRSVLFSYGTNTLGIVGSDVLDKLSFTLSLNYSESAVVRYLNGVESTASSPVGIFAMPNSVGQVSLGQTTVSSAHLNGHIKRFTIYDEALTADEVAQL